MNIPLFVDADTRVEKKKRDGQAQTPFKSIYEALGLEDTEESYQIKLLREI